MDQQEERLRDAQSGEPWMDGPDGKADLRWLVGLTVAAVLFWAGLAAWWITW